MFMKAAPTGPRKSEANPQLAKDVLTQLPWALLTTAVVRHLYGRLWAAQGGAGWTSMASLSEHFVSRHHHEFTLALPGPFFSFLFKYIAYFFPIIVIKYNIALMKMIYIHGLTLNKYRKVSKRKPIILPYNHCCFLFTFILFLTKLTLTYNFVFCSFDWIL